MPIQLRCPHCQKLLQVPDTAGGKQGKCPNCEGLMVIPQSGDAQTPTPGTSTPTSPSAPAPGPTSAPTDLFGATSAPAPSPTSGPTDLFASSPPSPPAGSSTAGSTPNNPFADPSFSPYQSPLATQSPPTWSAKGPPPSSGGGQIQLTGPAIGMIVGALLSLGWTFFQVVAQIGQGFDQLNPPPGASDAERTGFYVGAYGVLIVMWGVMPLVSLLTLVGGAMMLFRKGYGLAMTGAIAAIIPCQCCFPVTMGFGIWGVISLRNPAIRQLFR